MGRLRVSVRSRREPEYAGGAHLSGGGVEAEGVAEFLLRDGAGSVDLVAEDEEGDLAELLDGEESVEFGLGLVEAFRVLGVDEEDDAVDFGEVVLPQAAGLLVAAEVVGGELDVADCEFLRGGVQRGLEGGEAVVLEHVEEGGLACVVESEEEDLGVLVDEAEAGEDVPEVVEDAREEGTAGGAGGSASGLREGETDAAERLTTWRGRSGRSRAGIRGRVKKGGLRALDPRVSLRVWLSAETVCLVASGRRLPEGTGRRGAQPSLSVRRSGPRVGRERLVRAHACSLE